ncbi:formimidoylglutamate deiminase [Nakamurella antarctica]|uniref:Formimidoylglutamate deiminase n=1 Tax=Nakamurella antarctica TaxID=1902245 RepID=A0A3G8ZRI8_9ACTN|nr:formimidoylglutamate deiminase [Nakamurella antarctica]
MYRAELAWVTGLAGGELVGPIDIHCTEGVITSIEPAMAPAAVRLPGLVLPGFADAHSHVFHRALRGRTHAASGGAGNFWTWRDAMYEFADRLNPDTMYELAVAAYTEMVCAGITAVGEFHYLHHGAGGVPYSDPNAMGLAVTAAGARAGLAVTLLDVAYLAGGFSQPVGEIQRRFSDGSVGAWADRVAALPADLRTGVAIHSVRAVGEDALPAVVSTASGRVLHVHLSEQPAENEACQQFHGVSPTQLLARNGAITSRTAAVHATHLSPADIALLGDAHASIVMCPATEADLADGIGPARLLADAGAVISLGSDQHVITDPFAQARGLEYGERLATGIRGRFSPSELLHAATVSSHDAIDSPAGRLRVGASADLVAVRLDSARTAGSDPAQVLMSASAADVAVVVIGGRVVARDGIHVDLGDPGPLLGKAISRISP